MAIPDPEAGGSRWMAIDSLRRQDEGGSVNPALALLESNGAQLSALALTHLHADHTRGFLQLLDQREPNSPVGCLTAYADSRGRPGSTDDATKYFEAETTATVITRIRDLWKSEPDSHWELLAGNNQMVGSAKLEVLHPLDLPERRPRDLNAVSAPMLLTWRDTRILLGADLPKSGWKKVKTSLPQAHELAATHALKASHHGSAAAQHPVAVGGPPPDGRTCVVTPFNRLSRALPDYSDGQGIDLLLGRHRRVDVTNVPPSARGTETPRVDLLPEKGSFGPLSLDYELESAPPNQAWVAIAFDASGAEVERLHGGAAGTVV